MRYFSTRDRSESCSFSAAALRGLAPDGGLYIPERIPEYSAAVRNSLQSMSFMEIAYETIRPYVHENMNDGVLQDLIESAYPFTAPAVPVDSRFVLELFHGPTAAFKDFGARFMARAFSYFRRGEDKTLHILVATSGDTGGAVADGFFGVEGISVSVLYPRGRVSPLQERQIAGLGGNIHAIAVDGSFDDCQRLVKEAFSDNDLRKRIALSSANSINVSRLIPQAVYYTAAAGKLAAGNSDKDLPASPRSSSAACPPEDVSRNSAKSGPVLFCVPSGNFGNLTAGLYAREMGAPIRGFIAATNINRTVPEYLEKGVYEPRESIATISNAMDVGAPSNFERMKTQWSYERMSQLIKGCWIDDSETRKTIQDVKNNYSYILDPHGAVAWSAVDRLVSKAELDNSPVAVLATAHPAKFSETVEPVCGPVPVPESLASVMKRKVQSHRIPADRDALYSVLPL